MAECARVVNQKHRFWAAAVLPKLCREADYARWETRLRFSDKAAEPAAPLELLCDAVDFMSMDDARSPDQDTLVIALSRFDGAMTRVESLASKLVDRVERAEMEIGASAGADLDRARLAEALDMSKSREAELQGAAEEAAAALDAAIEDLRMIVTEDE